MFVRILLALNLFFLAAATQADIPLDSLHGPLCGMIDPDTRQQVAISPVFTRVNVVITDGMAQATVKQTFVNPFRSLSEVVYIFPLPEQGAVHGMSYKYANKLYVAQIMEKAKAQERYDSAVQNGQHAALLLQERPNIFMQRIASMGPGETASVEIKVSMPLKIVDGEMELAFPTCIGPRYGSGLPQPAPSPTGSPWNPPANRSGPEFEFNVLLQEGVDIGSVYSPSHPITVGDLTAMKGDLESRQTIEKNFQPQYLYTRGVLLKTAQTYPNKDYVLRMRRANSGQEFSVASYKDAKSATAPGYFMLNLYPDTGVFAGARPDLEVVLLVDISGSQYGWPLEREKEITMNLLSRLTTKDNLAVLAFNTSVTYAFGDVKPRAATQANIATAETFVRGLQAGDGTELLNAVKASLATPAGADKKRIFIFLTDGFITNEQDIVTLIAKDVTHPTIFTFGAGNNLNRAFLEECAAVGDGFATPLVEGDAVGPLVDAAWKRIQAPQLDHLQVDFGGLQVSDVQYPVSAKLYKGLPYRVEGKYAQGGSFTVTLKGDRNGTPVNISRRVTLATDDVSGWAVEKLWAREKIGRLVLDQGTTETNKDAITQVSVEHQVLSAYTAFLALEPLPANDPNNNNGNPQPIEVKRPSSAPGALKVDVRSGMLYLDWNGRGRVQWIRVFDLHGRLLFTFRAGGAQLARWIWDGRDQAGRVLTAGRYLVQVESDAGTRSLPFLWKP